MYSLAGTFFGVYVSFKHFDSLSHCPKPIFSCISLLASTRNFIVTSKISSFQSPVLFI